jgi:hypothetical protein
VHRTSALLCSVLRMIVGLHDGKPFEVSDADWRRGFYVVGASGSGKTTWLLNAMRQKIEAREGLAFIDPHGDASDQLLTLIPPHRAGDVILIEPAHLARSVPWNPLYNVHPDDHPRVADDIVASMKHVWIDSWGPRMEWVLINFIRTLLERNSTLYRLLHLSTNARLQRKDSKRIADPSVRAFWDTWWSWTPKQRSEALSPVQNKVGRLFGSAAIRNILGQDHSQLDIHPINLRDAMDKKCIIIVNLSKGKLGEENTHLFGSLLVAGIIYAALSRADVPEDERVPFNLFVDEVENFASTILDTGLSEGRKYKLTICAANQFTAQLDERLRNSIFGNVGNFVSFRVGPDDADILAKQFGLHHPVSSPDPTMHDSAVRDFCEKGLHSSQPLIQQAKYAAWAKVLREGNPETLRMRALPPPPPTNLRSAQMVDFVRKKFGTDRALVEALLNPPAPRRRVREYRE